MMRTKVLSVVAIMMVIAPVLWLVGIWKASTVRAGIEPTEPVEKRTLKVSQANLKYVQTYQKENGQPLDLLSQIGGSINEVYVDGTYAYVGETIGDYAWFRIVDVSNPLEPVPLGRIDALVEGVGFNVSAMAVNGDYAYVESYTGTYPNTLFALMVVDISNLNLPVPVKPMNVGDVGKVLLQDGHLYASTSGEIHIFDVQTPANPVEVSVYDTGAPVIDFSLSGQYLYIANQYEDLSIVDISNPAQPLEIAKYHYPSVEFAWILVEENYAYVYAYYGGTWILDISDPKNLVQMGFGPCGWLDVQGDFIYCMDNQFGLTIVDASDMANMIERGHFDLMGFTNDWVLQGNYIYAADDGPGLRILDVSNPDLPVEVAAYDPPGGSIYISGYGMTSGMVYRDGYVYTADFWSGVSIIDVHHPATPVLVNTYDTPGDVRDIEIAGDYAYLAETFQGLRILNLQNPEQPEEVALVPMQWAWEVEVIGTYVFVLNPDWIELMVDVSDPTNPIAVEVSTQTTPLEPDGGPYLYPHFTNQGVHQIDMSDPLHPVDMGVLEMPYYYGGDFKFISDTLYVTEIGGSGFQIVDISDPASPTILHIWEVGFSGWFAVQGDYLYVIYYGSVAVLDISDLENPILLATYLGTGLFPYPNADDFQIIPVGNFIYAGIRSSGLAVFYYDVSTSKQFIPLIFP